MRSGAALWAELRHHPTRYLSVLSAVALSVGFLVAIQVFVQTTMSQLGHRYSAHVDRADVAAWFGPEAGPVVADGKESFPGRPAFDALMSLEDALTAPMLLAGTTTIRSGVALHLTLVGIPSEPSLNWVEPDDGKLPSSPNEAVITPGVRDLLGIGIGDQVKTRIGTVTVVGEARNITKANDAVLFLPSSSPAFAQVKPRMLLLRATDGASPKELQERVREAIRASGVDLAHMTVNTAAEERAEGLEEATSSGEVERKALTVFAVVAMLVGAIIVSTTFGILITQRRRQIGLLRAVGSVRSQVWWRHGLEALAVGFVGSLAGALLGVAAAWVALSVLAGEPASELAMPWLPVAVCVLAGVLMTVLAAWRPIRAATRVGPLEALRPVSAAAEVRRHRVWLGAACGAMLLAGVGLAAGALTLPIPSSREDPSGVRDAAMLSLLMMLGAGVLLSVSVLAASSLYVPPLLRWLGGMFPRTLAEPRMAALNAARNPGRAAMTAVALMLAVGLTTSLVVTMGTLRESLGREISSRYPVDITIMASGSASPDGRPQDGDPFAGVDVGALEQVPGIAGVTRVAMGFVTVTDPAPDVPVAGATVPGGAFDRLVAVPADAAALPPHVQRPSVGEVLVPEAVWPDPLPATITVAGRDGTPVVLTPVSTPSRFWATLVSPATLAKLKTSMTTHSLWVRTDGSVPALQAQRDLTTRLAPMVEGELMVDGGLAKRANLMDTTRSLMLLVLGLLTIAVAIALIGVGNTLGLSVLERTRESALLRALGLQARGLRRMLLWEALLLTAVAVVVGLAAGFGFALLGSSVVLRPDGTEVVFTVPWDLLGGLVAACAVAAVLSSVAPGRRAASATPVAALADEG